MKMKKQLKPLLAILLIYSVSLCAAKAQDTYKIDPSSKMTIEGTSTIHDWTSEVTSLSGQAIINLDDQKVTGFNQVELTIPVTSIKGDRSGMDSRTYDALKKDKYPDIKFILTKTEKMEDNRIVASGRLTIAGVTRKIDVTADYNELPENKIAIKGQKRLKMSDFDVDPPTALMGAIRSGDAITVKFDLTFMKNNNLSYN